MAVKPRKRAVNEPEKDVSMMLAPMVTPAVEDRYIDAMRRRLLPNQVEGILRDALSGDLVQQAALFNIMVETWDRLQHNMRTLRDAASFAPFTVKPAEDPDGNVSDEAQERANLVKRALCRMRPDVTRMEAGERGLYKLLAQGTVLGHTVAEILWEVREDEHGRAVLPRAVRNVHPLYYAWPAGRTQAPDGADRLMFRPSGRAMGRLEDFPPDKFLTQIVNAHAGHPAVGATLRCLAKYWVAAMFGLEWLMTHAQLFGIPWRWANYKPDASGATKAAVASMLQNIGTAGWAALPEGTQMQLVEATRSAGELPQKLVREIADQACDIVILGQTLTTDSGREGSGSYALGKVHESVRRDCLASVVAEAAQTLSLQFAPAVLRLNYGDDRLCPEIVCDIPEPEDARANAQRDHILIRQLGMKVPKSWLYERHGVPMPGPDEEIFEAPPDEPPPQPGQPPQKQPKPGDKVSAARATPEADQLLEGLTEINDTLLQHAAAAGWAALQLENATDED